MKRVFVLGAIVLAGGVGTAILQAQQAAAPPQGRGGGPAFPPVSAAEKVADNLYMVPGQGGNTAVWVMANGVLLVDTKLANNGQAILDEVKKVTDKPVTYIVNTHTHGDHTGSNQFFPATVQVVVHENTAANMAKMDVFKDAANKHGLADRTYKDKLTLFRGKEEVELRYFGAAAHRRRHVRRVQERARDALGRRLRQQGAAVHRPRQRRQRRGVSGHAQEGGARDQERRQGDSRTQPPCWRGRTSWTPATSTS